MIEQILAEIRYPDAQRKLLTSNETLIVKDAIAICKSHEANITHMRQINTNLHPQALVSMKSVGKKRQGHAVGAEEAMNRETALHTEANVKFVHDMATRRHFVETQQRLQVKARKIKIQISVQKSRSLP